MASDQRQEGDLSTKTTLAFSSETSPYSLRRRLTRRFTKKMKETKS
jgi:hypothetical protein